MLAGEVPRARVSTPIQPGCAGGLRGHRFANQHRLREHELASKQQGFAIIRSAEFNCKPQPERPPDASYARRSQYNLSLLPRCCEPICDHLLAAILSHSNAGELNHVASANITETPCSSSRKVDPKHGSLRARGRNYMPKRKYHAQYRRSARSSFVRLRKPTRQTVKPVKQDEMPSKLAPRSTWTCHAAKKSDAP